MFDPDVAANAGYFGAIEVTTRPGTVLDPVPPAAVGTRALTCGVLGDLIVGALSQAVTGAAMAGSGPHHLVIFAGHDDRRGTFFVDYETIAGGAGARTRQHGLSAVRVHASGAANLPIEALENAFPLRVERYALREGSGGEGTLARRQRRGARLPRARRWRDRQPVIRTPDPSARVALPAAARGVWRVSAQSPGKNFRPRRIGAAEARRPAAGADTGRRRIWQRGLKE